VDNENTDTEPTAVSCASASLCVAGGRSSKVLSATEPTGDASAWKISFLDGRIEIFDVTSVSCPSAALCAVAGWGFNIGAAGTTAFVATSARPTGGHSAWKLTKVKARRVNGVSCPRLPLRRR
jgi:hypothetical protein